MKRTLVEFLRDPVSQEPLELVNAEGTQDLYLVFRSGGIYIDTIRLTR